MTTAEAMDALRRLHRSGTADLSTALAFARAGVREDWEALLALARGLSEDDDLLGVVVWLALLVGGTARVRPEATDLLLDVVAEAERVRA
jgi:hypothetical protein